MRQAFHIQKPDTFISNHLSLSISVKQSRKLYTSVTMPLALPIKLLKINLLQSRLELCLILGKRENQIGYLEGMCMKHPKVTPIPTSTQTDAALQSTPLESLISEISRRLDTNPQEITDYDTSMLDELFHHQQIYLAIHGSMDQPSKVTLWDEDSSHLKLNS